MKLKYLLLGLVSSAFLLPSCVEVDELKPQEGVGLQQLNVKGYLVSDPTYLYDSEIDEANGTITVKVPYYISDVDPIMGDLTQMKLEAELPSGYIFSPILSGIHDLAAGFQTNLVDPRGGSRPFTIKAEAVKSDAARVISAKLTESERTAVVITDPENEGEHGKIVVAKTSSSIDGALHEVALTVSPWATVTCSSIDPITGYVDFSVMPEITITAQNGVDKTVYDVSVETPEILPNGIGYISALWGFQIYEGNEYGFEKANNTTMAVVDDYLIISNFKSAGDMIVLDRFNGKKLDVKVNTTGMPTDRQFRAICHDDANHMIAASYTDNSTMTTPTAVRIFAWKDGIENPPTSIFWADWNGEYFAAASGYKTRELFHNVNCRGDIFNGDAVITTTVLQSYRCWFFQFKDGKPDGNLSIEYAGGMVSMWASSNCAPMTNKAPYGYIWHTGNFRGTVVCVPAGTSATRGFNFDQPSSHWWAGPTNTRSCDYIEFNGCNLLAVSNGNHAQTSAQRLYVANIGPSPSASSLKDGFIFDSREGNAAGTAGIPGTGYSPTGMTSAYTYETGKVVLGDNFDEPVNRAMGDVKFARSSDGNAVQVYMLTPDQGIFAYELTRFGL